MEFPEGREGPFCEPILENPEGREAHRLNPFFGVYRYYLELHNVRNGKSEKLRSSSFIQCKYDRLVLEYVLFVWFNIFFSFILG